MNKSVAVALALFARGAEPRVAAVAPTMAVVAATMPNSRHRVDWETAKGSLVYVQARTGR
jgi:hypothetical protein